MDLDLVSIATFNLYNVQLPGLPMNPRQKPWTDDEFRRKVSWDGATLKELDADIVGLQAGLRCPTGRGNDLGSLADRGLHWLA